MYLGPYPKMAQAFVKVTHKRLSRIFSDAGTCLLQSLSDLVPPSTTDKPHPPYYLRDKQTDLASTLDPKMVQAFVEVTRKRQSRIFLMPAHAIYKASPISSHHLQRLNLIPLII